MTGLLDGALDVLAHVIVLGSIFGAASFVDRYMARRRRDRDPDRLSMQRFEQARNVTSPRSLPR